MGSDLSSLFGYSFTDVTLLHRALTHSSAVADTPHAADNNERLEFIGDRVLGLAVAEMLYRRYPDEAEGDLAKRLTALVQQAALVRVAQAQDIGRHLRLSAAETKVGLRDAMLADAVEAVIGAIFLDGGYSAAAVVIAAHWAPFLEADLAPPEDPKTALQEWVQARGLPLPRYETVGQSGPDHAPQFTVRASIAGTAPVEATASNKRLAEKEAARILLETVSAKGKTA